jgi:hypothetical protein
MAPLKRCIRALSQGNAVLMSRDCSVSSEPGCSFPATLLSKLRADFCPGRFIPCWTHQPLLDAHPDLSLSSYLARPTAPAVFRRASGSSLLIVSHV